MVAKLMWLISGRRRLLLFRRRLRRNMMRRSVRLMKLSCRLLWRSRVWFRLMWLVTIRVACRFLLWSWRLVRNRLVMFPVLKVGVNRLMLLMLVRVTRYDRLLTRLMRFARMNA